MVHIANDGQVLQSPPWSITRFFSSVFDMVFMFFRTLISPGSSAEELRGGSSRGGSSSSGSGSSGGSGWGGSGGSGSNSRPGFPNRRIGRIQNHSSLPIPGGCAGGACGR